MRQRLVVLGSTGVIGRLALEVARLSPDEFEVAGLACYRGEGTWKEQLAEFKPTEAVRVKEEGEAAMVQMIKRLKPDVVVVAVVGTAGIRATLTALKVGAKVALATKEVLVVAGKMVIEAVEENGGLIVPVDSEHAAIFMARQAGKQEDISTIYLTMGKGRLASLSKEELDRVEPKELWVRKTWPMGKKIAVDSATGMNKAFEVIEAHWLFGVKTDQIEVVVHPEYVCHSAIKWQDGSILAELGEADMYRYVHYALFYPERTEIRQKEKQAWSLMGKTLSFEKPNTRLFPAVELGHYALQLGGEASAFLHGADRATVEAYIGGEIKFNQMTETTKQILEKYGSKETGSVEGALRIEAEGYEAAQKYMESL